MYLTIKCVGLHLNATNKALHAKTVSSTFLLDGIYFPVHQVLGSELPFEVVFELGKVLFIIVLQFLDVATRVGQRPKSVAKAHYHAKTGNNDNPLASACAASCPSCCHLWNSLRSIPHSLLVRFCGRFRMCQYNYDYSHG